MYTHLVDERELYQHTRISHTARTSDTAFRSLSLMTINSERKYFENFHALVTIDDVRNFLKFQRVRNSNIFEVI